MESRNLRILLTGAVAVLLLVALMTPWWAWDVEVSGSMGGMNFDEADTGYAGPFRNGDDIIETSQSVLSGILVLLALILVIGALALMLIPDLADNIRSYSTWALLVAGVLGLLIVILAPTTWPTSDGPGFWDSSSNSAMGFSAQVTSYAHAGWYLGLLAVLLLAYLVASPFLAAARQGESATVVPTREATANGACQATTKAGTPCSRRATQGTFCGTHA